MGIYQERVVPALIGLAMAAPLLHPFRRRVVGAARGRVLEVGVGAGDNLGFYSPDVTELFALDPSARLLERARRRVPARPEVRFLQAGAEAIPLDDRSLDTVVMTWTACSIPDAPAALSEIRRVLKPSGRLLFVEHGRSPDAGLARWQDRLDPIWSRISGGCHMNRRIDEALPQAGFRVDALATGYGFPGPRVLTFLYEGAASPL